MQGITDTHLKSMQAYACVHPTFDKGYVCIVQICMYLSFCCLWEAVYSVYSDILKS